MRQSVYDAAGVEQTRTTFEYDNYVTDVNHAPLVDRAGITGHDAAYTPSHQTRGNATATTHYLLSQGAVTGSLTAYAQYDVAGNVVKAIDARGNVSEVSYADSYADGVSRNTFAFPTLARSPVPDPSGQYGSTTALTTSTVYDFSTGLVTSTTDANNKSTTFEHNDALDRRTKVTRPDGGRTTYTYVDAHVCGPYVETHTLLDTSGREAVSWQFFDGLGRPYLAETFDGQDANNLYLRVDTRYDSLGRVSQVSNPYRSAGCTAIPNPSGNWTTTTYDALGRVRAVTTPDGAAVKSAYSGNVVQVTDQAGRSRRSRTDALGRLVEVVEFTRQLADPFVVEGQGPGDYVTNYQYDALGNLRKVDQGGQFRYFAYDSLGRLLRAKNPEQAAQTSLALPANMVSPLSDNNNSWTLSYAYDEAGNLTSRTDARGVTTTYAYDNLSRNKTITYSDSTPAVSRFYDNQSAPSANALGRLWRSETAGSSGSKTVINFYDSVGRPLSQSQHFWRGTDWGPAFTTSREYDLAGGVTSQTYPSGRVVAYGYDAAGRLSSFTGNLGDGQARTYSSELRYHELGGRQQERFGTQTPVYNRGSIRCCGNRNRVSLLVT